MKKLTKMFALMLVFVLVMSPALAETSASSLLSALLSKNNQSTLSIPDLADMSDNIELMEANEESKLYVYTCSDSEEMVSCIADYAGILQANYGFGGLEIDEVSSDNFIYIYLSSYDGDADIQPEYMDECPEACYIIFALTGYNGGCLAAVMAADGIVFNAEMPETQLDSEEYIAPVLGYNGLLVLSPEEFIDGIPACDTLGAQDNYYSYRYIDEGQPYDDDGDADTWALFGDYVDALVATGYYEIIHHWRDSLEECWYLAYTGPEEIETISVHNNKDAEAGIIVHSLLGDVWVFFSEDIVANNFEEVAESKGYSVSSGGATSGGSSGVPCGTCGFDGRCNDCGGSGYVQKYIYGLGYERRPCDGFRCNGGSCSACGGDGYV